MKEVLSDAENLTKEKIDKVLNDYLKDFKEKSLKSKDWHSFVAASMNAYTRILSKEYSSFCFNNTCSEYDRINITYNIDILFPEEGTESSIKLTLLPNDSSSSLFFDRNKESSF